MKRNWRHLCKIVDNSKSPFLPTYCYCASPVHIKRARVIKCKANLPQKTYFRPLSIRRQNRKFIYCYCDNELFELLRSFTQRRIFSHLEGQEGKNKHIQHISTSAISQTTESMLELSDIDNSTRYKCHQV